MKRVLGYLAIAGLLMFAAPAQKAEAAMATPGVATALQSAPESLATEVRWRRRGYYAPRRYYVRRYYRPRYYAPRRYYGPRIRFY